jgi:hypothetical protein
LLQQALLPWLLLRPIAERTRLHGHYKIASTSIALPLAASACARLCQADIAMAKNKRLLKQAPGVFKTCSTNIDPGSLQPIQIHRDL